MSNLLIRGGRVLDPARGADADEDILVVAGQIQPRGTSIPSGTPVLEAAGLTVAPGFVDIHCHLRDPGYEYKETLETGTRAAARGGFTTVCCMPNTNPPIDSRATVDYIVKTAASVSPVRVLPIGCVTQGRGGCALAELGELADAGCVAFSDDGSPIPDSGLIRSALEYAKITGLPVIDHCEDPELARGGAMHEGWVSTRLGLSGQPAAAEDALVARDISLAALLDAPVHIAHVSTRASVELVRQAKQRAVPVTAEVTPHHLTLTHEAVAFATEQTSLAYDTNAKVNPPLRSPDDLIACVEGLRSGVIDCIATDHAPHADYEKNVEFDQAPFGMSGLETAFGLSMTLVDSGQLSFPAVVNALTAGPVRALNLHRAHPGLGSLAEGAPGDIVLIDPNHEWRVEPELFASKGRNTPLAGRVLRGRVVATVVGGRLVWAERDGCVNE